MKKRVFLFIFILFSIAIYFISDVYRDFKIKEYSYNKFTTIASFLESELDVMIKEKQNATLSIAISLSHGHDLANILSQKDDAQNFIKNITESLKETIRYQNVWIQIIDSKGVSYARNWDEEVGENNLLFRSDVSKMLQQPKIYTSISVGMYSLSFKAMVPIYNDKNHFLGFIEVITHFDSIAKNIQNKGDEPIIVVSDKFKDSIKKPLSTLFVENNYIANTNADPKLIALLKKEKLKTFISEDNKYLIYKDYLIYNYPILDNQSKLLANFLIFSPLNSIDVDSIQRLNLNITLFAIFIFLLGGFLFFSLYNSIKHHEQSLNKNHILFFIFLFLSLSGIYFLALNWYYENRKNDYLESHNKNIKRDFEIINYKYAQFANTAYTLVINKPEILTILSDAYSSDSKKEQARKRLYTYLQKEYLYLQNYGLKQLHFHLKTNESFLRFHRPLQYGDSLNGIRPTIEHVNKYISPISGFEEGRTYNGFRHVYPLLSLDKDGMQEHLGSVEISFGADVLLKEFIDFYGAKAGFLMSQKEVDKHVFENERINYSPSIFNTFLYEVSIKKQLLDSQSHIETNKLCKKNIKYVEKQIFKGEIFSIISIDNSSIYTFVPLKNPISKKVVGMILLQEDTNEINSYLSQFYIFMLFSIATTFFALLYIYREFSSRHRFELLSKTTQNILDSQDTIVVVSDGKSIINANKRFFDFFGLSNLKEFKDNYNCICDFFLNEPRFFHLGLVKEDQSWVNEIMKLSNKNRIVSMQSKFNKNHSFAVLVNSFDEDYVISFSDISERLNDHFSLELKVIHDSLTNAYNREYFNLASPKFIQESSQNGLFLGLIIFDIDHFKSVNDTYGHNTGDIVLKHLVEIVNRSIRTEDILVRWGGEEFIILAKTKSLDDIKKIAEFIRKQIEIESFIEVENITCSFGVTLYNGIEDIHETIKRADVALYKAKNAGRNCVVIAN